MTAPNKTGLCETCRHRAASMARALKWRKRGGKGIACDPAPKAECKDHYAYGRSGTRENCRDYQQTNT